MTLQEHWALVKCFHCNESTTRLKQNDKRVWINKTTNTKETVCERCMDKAIDDLAEESKL